jgi:type II secretory pathway predicted ATPase ExeA
VVSARFKGLDSVAELLRRGRTSAPAAEIEPILVELAAARTEGGPLFIVVHDADFACAGALDRLRIATESFSDESVQIRLVLCGGAFLLHLLELPQLRGLSTRVTSLIRLQS